MSTASSDDVAVKRNDSRLSSRPQAEHLTNELLSILNVSRMVIKDVLNESWHLKISVKLHLYSKVGDIRGSFIRARGRVSHRAVMALLSRVPTLACSRFILL